MLASVVTHSSKCKVAPAALLELNSACELFASAANHGGRAVKFLVRASLLHVYCSEVNFPFFKAYLETPSR